jgi:hypothetical protein
VEKECDPPFHWRVLLFLGVLFFQGPNPMSFLISLVVIAVLIVAFLAVLGKDESKSQMTEQEFEEEARQASAMRAAVTGLHKFFQPDRVTQIVEEQQRAKEKFAVSGDPSRDPDGDRDSEEEENPHT